MKTGLKKGTSNPRARLKNLALLEELRRPALDLSAPLPVKVNEDPADTWIKSVLSAQESREDKAPQLPGLLDELLAPASAQTTDEPTPLHVLSTIRQDNKSEKAKRMAQWRSERPTVRRQHR